LWPASSRSQMAAKTAKKDKTKEKKKPDPVDESSDDDDDDEEEEEEELESAHARAKRLRGRAAFMRLIRSFLSLIPLGLVLARQPFMMRPRASGVNAIKLRPLDVAIAGTIHWAASSPMIIRQPRYYTYVNATARWLLTPNEYAVTAQSKRAMPNEKTIQGAHKKTAKSLARMVDKDAQLREIVTAPQPNFPLLGSYALLLGCLLSPLAGGLFDYVILLGGVLLMQGGRALGMEAQPELYVAGVVTVLCIAAADAAGKVVAAPAAKRKRR